MNELELTDLIIKLHKLDPGKILKRPIRGLNGFSIRELVFAIITTNSIKEAGIELGYTENPVKQACREILLPLFPYRHCDFGNDKNGARSWKFELLASIEHKYCYVCRQILHYSDYHSNKDNTDSLSAKCKTCAIFKTKEQKLYIVQRTPKWSSKDRIYSIYNNCPKGMHVDHIIPLRGALVSGLHVPENLQYLSAEENIKKGNRFNV